MVGLAKSLRLCAQYALLLDQQEGKVMAAFSHSPSYSTVQYGTVQYGTV